jgi:hypothetical protein
MCVLSLHNQHRQLCRQLTQLYNFTDLLNCPDFEITFECDVVYSLMVLCIVALSLGGILITLSA